MSMIVRKLRIERGWTQEHLSQLTGLSVRSIQRIERGQTCSLETQNALAAGFEIERSLLSRADSSTNEVAPPSPNLVAIVYVQGLKGLLSHAFLFGMLAAVGFVMGFGQPAVLWCLVGWSVGLLAHAMTAFGLVNIFSSEWERRQIQKWPEAQPPINPIKRLLEHWARRFLHHGRVSMKIFARISGSVSLLAGVALLAWVSYDATSVMQSLGLQARMDEAAVALTTLLLGALLLASGIYIWRRVLRSSNSIAA